MSYFSEVSEYAQYRKYFYVIDFTTALSLFGINTLLLRKDKEFISYNIISSILIINLLSFISIVAFGIIKDFSCVVFVQVLLFVFLNTLYQIITGLIIRFHKCKLYFRSTSSNFIIVSVILAYLIVQNKLTFANVYYVRIGSLLLYILPFLITFRDYFKEIKRPNLKKVWSLFKEACPIGLGVIVGSCTLYADKFIASLMSDYDLAVYANASANIPFVGVAITTMSAYYIPIIHREYNQSNLADAKKSLNELFLFGGYIGIIVFSILFCNAKPIITLLYSARYSDSIALFQIFSLGYLLRIISYTHVIVALELEKIILRRMIIELLLQVSVSVLLYKYFGVYGLATSVILVLACWSVPYNIYYFSKKLQCNIRDIIPLKKLGVFFLKCFVVYYAINLLTNYICNNALITIIITSVLFIIVNHKELLYIIQKLR